MIDVERVFLPYCAQKLADSTYVLIGRDYKPLGWIESCWSDWEKHPIVYAIEGLTTQIAAEISYKGDPDVERIYFYNDACPPWRGIKERKAYEKRLAKLFELPVRLLVGHRVHTERSATASVECHSPAEVT